MLCETYAADPLALTTDMCIEAIGSYLLLRGSTCDPPVLVIYAKKSLY